jgi:hypothetical protein
MSLHIVYRDPSDPEAKPPPIRHIQIDAPSGIRFDTAAVPVCTATDDEIQLLGRRACPAESRVGGGTLTVIEGFGPPIDPVITDAVIFNGGTEIIETFSPHGADAPVVAIDRITISGSTLVGNPPAEPGGPPDGQTAVREIDFTFPVATAFVVTPTTCPPDGHWRTNATFVFADETTQRASSTTPCAMPPTQGPTTSGGQQSTADVSGTLPVTGAAAPAAWAVLALLGGLLLRPRRRHGRRQPPDSSR